MTRTTMLLTILLLASGAAFAGDGRIVVTVLDASGKPLADAEVLVWAEGYTCFQASGGAGRAVIVDVPAGRVSVFATAERHVATERHDVGVPSDGEIPITFRLEPGISFDGRLVDAEGKPVVDAQIEVMAGGSYEGFGILFANKPPYDRVWTGDDGAFHVRGIPKDGIATLLVRAEGFQEARVAVKAFGDTVRPNPLVIRLEPGARVVGVVTDPDGRPVRGATIYVVPADAEQLRENPRIVSTSTGGGTLRALTSRSDEQGRFEIPGIALDRGYVAMAVANGFARSAESSLLTAKAGRLVVEAKLRLRRPAVLVLRLLDGEETFRKARVRIGGFMSGLQLDAAGEDGLYRFDELRPGKHEVRVEAPGALNRTIEVEVAEGETVERTVRLDRGVAIEGVLLDETGKPVAGARVTAERTDLETRGGPLTEATVETDEKGRFRLAGLRRIEYEIDVWQKGFDILDKVVVAAPKAGLELRGAHLGVVVMSFRAPAGKALPARISVYQWSEDGSGTGTQHDLDDGAIELLGFRGTKETLKVTVSGYVQVVREVVVKPGERKVIGPIDLDPGRTLTGRVVDHAGKPVVGAMLDHDAYTEATSAADGSFTLRHLPAGRVLVRFDAEDFVPGSQTVEVGEKGAEATIRISRGAVLRGVLRDGKGEPLGEYWIQLRRRDPEAPTGWSEEDGILTEDDGTFEERVATGPARLTFLRERGAVPIVLGEFVLTEGETRTAELVLRD